MRMFLIFLTLLLIALPLMAEDWQAVPEEYAVLAQVSEVDALVGLPDT